MQVDMVKLICFSPTGTTRKILRGLAAGMQAAQVEEIDLTPPDACSKEVVELGSELAVMGMPVYAGRLPPEAVARLQRLRGNQTPAVLVVVYGNRAYEDALLELSDLASAAGFVPVAGGAFIGEHSFTSDAAPLSVGRPDAVDLAKAAQFGESVHAKLEGMTSLDDLSPLVLPGNRPYRDLKQWENLMPETDEALCTLCGDCADVCPTGAVTVKDSVQTDGEKCIVCCACIKVCPTGARMMHNKRILKTANWLFENCSERREPEVFL
ncbi:MAG: 4Fe-4S binding protein [Anaerolineaceae bacterium]|nr:4Fe-4S binding protein [Anaerolineaceae bacterium]